VFGSLCRQHISIGTLPKLTLPPTEIDATGQGNFIAGEFASVAWTSSRRYTVC
jgi:hypothetical protein